MAGNISFTMIKPHAVSKGYIGAIMDMINKGGFKFKAIKMLKLTRDQASEFYAIHKGKAFYGDLCDFMSSGPIVAAIIEKENAVKAYRDYIGATNPDEAHKGSIRDLYGTNVQQNAVHGSDSDENAMKEASFFFSSLEIH